MGQAERMHDDALVAGQATAKYRSRGVPSDWYVDPADPDAAERYNLDTSASLQDQATAFLAQHDALQNESLLAGQPEQEDDLDPPMEIRNPASSTLAQPVKALLSACLRTRLTAAEGSPAPLSSPVDPRTTSTRS